MMNIMTMSHINMKIKWIDVALQTGRSSAAATEHKISEEAKNAEAAKSGLARPHDDAWGTLLTW